MKNICFILVCLTFLSVLPSYATKVIVNDDQDRIVYSRSSRPPKEIITEQNIQNEEGIQGDFNNVNGQVKNSWIRNQSIRNKEYNESIIPLFMEFRTELAGHHWGYPEYKKFPISPEEINELKAQQNGTKNYVEENTVQTTYVEDPRFNRTSREAADYYMVDKVKAPNRYVPSWVPEQ